MSLEVTTRIWNRSELKSGDKLLLLALGEIADIDGFCWPGIKLLAEMTGQSPRQLARTMNNLRVSGEVIIWDQQGQHGGRGYTNIYLVITGLTEAEIREIVDRRFELKPDEIDSVLAQKGDIYRILCELKRVTPATLLRTRKGVTSDSHKEKRVTHLVDKGDTSDSRTIIEPLSNDTTTTGARLSEFYLAHVNPTGGRSQAAVDRLNTILETYKHCDIDYALTEAIDKGANSLKYIETICKRRASGQPDQKKGHDNGRKQQGTHKGTNQTGAGQSGSRLDELPSVNPYTGETVPAHS